MALLSTQSIRRSGLASAYATPTVSDTFVPGQFTFVHVKNASGTACNVAIAAPAIPLRDMVLTALAVTVPITTGDRMIGPIRPEFFADPTTGLVTVTFSVTASVLVGVFDLSQP